MSQALLVDKKTKNAQSAGNWDHDPCKAIQTNKTNALTKQKQQHILIVPVQRKVRNISQACRSRNMLKVPLGGLGDWRNKWHSYCTSMGSDAPALLRKVKLKIAPQVLPFVISCKYSHSYKVHKVSQDHPCGFGDVNPKRCLPLQVVYSHHLFSHLPPCHTVSRIKSATS